ncbi:Protein kinase-like protein [Quillaja saponaria]|uniref:Protein kinase-like protein n=1 Tax=Quillaja saponaria TaxID=32244 RepID=A0AAD7VN02_QUISA|nr:Protein kinase-like protein [Quillaja saponaria]
MGCICSKVSAVEDTQEGLTKILPSSRKGSSDVKALQLNSWRRDEGVGAKDKLDKGDVKFSLVDKKANNSLKLFDGHTEKKIKNKPEVTSVDHPGLGRVPKATEGEQVAAGWPGWLSAVAGEAIKGWVPRSANTFEKLEKIGQGTYSSVYKATDVTHQRLVALKKVRFDNLDPESVKFMAREIFVLRWLDHPNVIKLEGLIASRTSRSLYLVVEYMEHDLTGLASRPGIKFSEPQVKCYMQQLLRGLEYCHSHGILHRDIKGSNLLIDNTGTLKIGDFGLASFFDPHQRVQLTSRVVTLWYRPPELLLGASHYGVAVDLWSTGCILGELYTGKPILPGKTEVEQLHKIFKLCGSPPDDYWAKLRSSHSTVFKPPHHYRRCVPETFKELPAAAMGLMETLLSIDPANRGTAASALNSEFFTTEPIACDPSSLPKYPPSKEIDAKLRDEVARRQGAVGGRELIVGLGSRQEKEHCPFPAAKANVDLHMSMQNGQGFSNSKSRGELFESYREEAVSGFLVVPRKESDNIKEVKRDFPEHTHKRLSHSGPLVHGPRWSKTGRELDERLMAPAKLSNLSGLLATRTLISDHQQGKPGPVQDKKWHTQRSTDFNHMADGRACTKEQNLGSRESRGNKIYLSGPLLVSSNNVDQMLKEHDRKLQEFSRRARLDKTNRYWQTGVCVRERGEEREKEIRDRNRSRSKAIVYY